MPFSPRTAGWDPNPFSEPLGMAAWWRREGYAITDIPAMLKRRFPNVTPQQLGKVFSQFERINPIQGNFDSAYDWQQMNRVDIPRQPTLKEAYRFFVDVHYYDLSGQRLTTRTVVVDSPRNLTRGELVAEAEAEANRLFNQSRAVYDKAVDYDQVGSVRIQTILITRRT